MNTNKYDIFINDIFSKVSDFDIYLKELHNIIKTNLIQFNINSISASSLIKISFWFYQITFKRKYLDFYNDFKEYLKLFFKIENQQVLLLSNDIAQDNEFQLLELKPIRCILGILNGEEEQKDFISVIVLHLKYYCQLNEVRFGKVTILDLLRLDNHIVLKYYMNILTDKEINISDDSKIFIIIYLLYCNVSFISELKHYNQFVLDYVVNNFTKITTLTEDKYRFLVVFNIYFQINQLNRNLAFNCFKINHTHPDFIYQLFNELLSSTTNIYNIYLATMEFETLYRLLSSKTLPNQLMTSSSTIKRLNQLISPNKLETFAIVLVYHSKNLPIPDSLYQHISMTSSILDLNQLKSKPSSDTFKILLPHSHSGTAIELVIDALVTLHNHNPSNTTFLAMAFRIIHDNDDISIDFKVKTVEPFQELFQSLFMQPLKIYNVNPDTLPFWIRLGRWLTTEQICSIITTAIQYETNLQIVLEPFLNFVKDGKYIIQIATGKSNRFNITNYFSLPTTKLDHVVIFLEDLFLRSFSFYLLDRDRSGKNHCIERIKIMMERFQKEDINRFNKLIHNVMKYCLEFNILVDLSKNDQLYSKILNFFPTNNYNSISTIINPNYMLIQEILKYLLYDKQSTTKWKVQLSTISKKVFHLCSVIFSSYPIESIEIKSKIQYIGSQFCLFKNAPHHICNYELQFIPEVHIQSCLENLVSLSQHLYFNQYNTTAEIVNAKNISHLNLFYNRSALPIYNPFRHEQFFTSVQLIESVSMGLVVVTTSENKHFLRYLVDHYNNECLQSINYYSLTNLHGLKSLSIIKEIQQMKPTLSFNVDYLFNSRYVKGKELPTSNELVICKSVIIIFKCEQDFLFPKLDLLHLERVVLRFDYEPEDGYGVILTHSRFITYLKEFLALISQPKYHSIKYLEIYQLFSRKSIPLFNEFNLIHISTIVDFKDFKPIIESNSTISIFYR